MKKTDITDTELDAIDKYWAAPTGRDYSQYAQTTVLRLVAALRSERTQNAALKSDNQVLRENATWNEEDAAELERVSAELERERTQYETRSRAYEECLDQLGAAQIELLRERTQNRERGAFLLRLRGLIWLMYPDEITPEAKRQFDAVFDEVGAAARAVLSTQEENERIR